MLFRSWQDQQSVVEVLEVLLHRFAKWSDARRIAADVTTMQHQQQELIDNTNALDTVGKTRDDLTAEEAALLEQLVRRQAQLARRADRLLLELEQLYQQVAAENPAFAAMLRRAFEAAKQTDVAAAAHEAQRNLDANQIGSATSRQNEVKVGLQEIAEAISKRPPDPNDTLLANVKTWLITQQALSVATKQLDARDANQMTTSERQRVARTMAARQEGLADEITVAAQLKPGPVVQFTLSEASRLMNIAARALDGADTGQITQKSQQAAQLRLIRLAEALGAEGQRPRGTPASDGDATGRQSDAEDAGQRIGIADLQLLRQLQLEINQQTNAIELARDEKGLLRDQIGRASGRERV